MLSTYSSWYHLNKANQFYCGPDHLVLLVGKKKKKRSFSFISSYSYEEIIERRPDQQQLLKSELCHHTAFFHQLAFFPLQHEAISQMELEDRKVQELERHCMSAVFPKFAPTHVYSCFRKDTSRVLPACSSPCGFATLLDFLTLLGTDHEAVLFKKINK